MEERAHNSNAMRSILEVVVFLLCIVRYSHSTPKSSPNWEELISTDGIKFSGRNGKAQLRNGYVREMQI